jgi:hypothetical protein
MPKPTEEQSTNLRQKYLDIETAFASARLYSNQAACTMASEERRFLSVFLFARAVTSVFLDMDRGEVASPMSEKLSDMAAGLHNDICNECVGIFCFTDADSPSCPCNCNGIDDLDIYDYTLEKLAQGEAHKGKERLQTLVESLVPLSSLLIGIATIEQDEVALATAKRIHALLTC